MVRRSLPSRERELKLGLVALFECLYLSLPSRERELKQKLNDEKDQWLFVAPFAGARVETISISYNFNSTPRRSLRGSAS